MLLDVKEGAVHAVCQASSVEKRQLTLLFYMVRSRPSSVLRLMKTRTLKGISKLAMFSHLVL